MKQLKIGIVGGSISGCAAAAVLSRAGHDAKVYERSVGSLESRGVGITTPSTVIENLKQKNLIDKKFPYFETEAMTYYVKDPASEEYGRSPYAMRPETTFGQFNWGDLWRNLRKRVPSGAYCENTNCQVFNNSHDHCEITFTDKGKERFDLVIFADGYRSMGRQILFPNHLLNYSGYFAWRGVVEERTLSSSAPLEKNTAFPWYSKGQTIFYFVPSPEGGINPGERWLNWVVYVPANNEALKDYLTDKNGKSHTGSLPPGGMRSDAEAQLKEGVTKELPDYYARIINNSEDTFIQPVYDVCLPDYRVNRVCLIGDAATLARPHSGSGVMKGMEDSLALAKLLDDVDNIDQALEQWSTQQAETAKQSFTLGSKLGQAYMENTPDMASLNEEQIMNWFIEAVS